MFVKGVQLTDSPEARDFPAEKQPSSSWMSSRPAFRVMHLTTRMSSEKSIGRSPQKVVLKKMASAESQQLTASSSQSRTPMHESGGRQACKPADRRFVFSTASLSGSARARKVREDPSATRLQDPVASTVLAASRCSDPKVAPFRPTHASLGHTDCGRRQPALQPPPGINANRLRLSEILKDNREIEDLNSRQLPIQFNSLLIQEHVSDADSNSSPLKKGSLNWRKVRLVHKSAQAFAELSAAAKKRGPVDPERPAPTGPEG